MRRRTKFEQNAYTGVVKWEPMQQGYSMRRIGNCRVTNFIYQNY
jgi:hypothetical protein